MEKPWKVIVAFVGVFIAGAVFGGLFTFRAAGRRAATLPVPVVTTQPTTKTPERPAPPPRIEPRMMRTFAQRLNLTVDQQATIRPIVARAEEDMNFLRRDNLRATTRVMERMYADVSASLSPEQKEQLEKERQKLQERMAEELKKRGQQPENRKGEKGEKNATPPARPPSD